MFYTLYYTTICFLRNALRMFCKLAQLSQKGKMLFPFLTVFAVLLFTVDFASAEQDPYLSPKECVDRTVALPGDTSLELVYVEPGSCILGTPEAEAERSEYEENPHRITLTRGFWIGKYEVTQAQYKAIMGEDPTEGTFFGIGPDYPVYYVSWVDAMEFCRKLTLAEQKADHLPKGYRFILPTKAQWRYAFHAGSTALSLSKNNAGISEPAVSLEEIAWYQLNSGASTHPVGQKKPNAWGIYDMQGNVGEWCYDPWSRSNENAIDPIGVFNEEAPYRTVCGLGWNDPGQSSRIEFTYPVFSKQAGFHQGFRVALSCAVPEKDLESLPPRPEKVDITLQKSKQALLLSSYSLSHPRTWDYISNLQNKTKNFPVEIEWHIIFLNANHQTDPDVEDKTIQTELKNIQEGKYDFVVTLNDAALEKLIGEHSDVIPETLPVLAIKYSNDILPFYQKHPNMAGIHNHYDLLYNLRLIPMLWPDTKEILVLQDPDVSAGMRQTLTNFQYGVKINYLNQNGTTPIEQSIKEIQSKTHQTSLFIPPWKSMPEEPYHSYEALSEALTKGATRPFLTASLDFLGHGALGGYIVRPEDTAQDTMLLIEQVLAYGSAQWSPFWECSFAPVFDYQKIIQYKLNPKALPANAVLLNFQEPPEKSRGTFIFYAISIAGIVFLLYALFFVIHNRLTRRYLQLYRSLPARIGICDEDEKILFLSQHYSPSKTVGKDMYLKDIPDIDYPLISRKIQEVFLNDRTETFEYSAVNNRRMMTITPTQYGKSSLKKVVWITLDNSELQKIRERSRQLFFENQKNLTRLEKIAQQWQHIVDLFPMPFFVKNKDNDHRYALINKEFAKVLNKSAEEIIGKTDYDLFSKEIADMFLEENTKHLEPEKVSVFTRPVSIGDSVIQAKSFISTFKDMDNQQLLVGFNTDISREMDLIHRAEESSKAKSFFLASVSHELRTPLNSLLGFINMLRNGTLDRNTQLEYLNNINMAGDALLHLINDILDLSKLESGEMPFYSELIDFNRFCKENCGVFAHSIEEKGLQYQTDLQPMPMLNLDSARMRQTFYALLGNALQYTQKGKISVSVRFQETSDSEGTLTIKVSDTGIGIAPEDQKNIFKAFVKLSRMRGTRGSNSGSGLSLSIIHGMIEKRGGTLEVESELGKGSTFTVTLPKIQFSKQTPQDLPRGIAPKNINHRIRSVLLVDDIPMNLTILTVIVKKMGLEPTTVSSGKEALRLLRQKPFGLILTDLWMPEMNGAELAKAIRDLPGYQDVQILAVTADVESRENFDMSYFDGILTKPITQEQILQYMRN